MSSQKQLALTRVLFFLMLFWFTARWDYFLMWAEVPEEFWHPNGLMKIFSHPFLDQQALTFWVSLWRWTLLPAALGLAYRFFAPINITAGFVVIGFAHSFGYQTHTYMPLLLAGLVLAFAPSADAFSLDRLIWGAQPKNEEASIYKWSLFNMKLVFCLVFFAAGASKIMNGGWDWIAGDTLRNYFLRAPLVYGDVHPTAHRLALNFKISQWPLVINVLALLTILIEFLSPTILLKPRWAWLFVPALFIMQVVIYFTIYVKFASYMALYTVWIVFFLSEFLQTKKKIRI